MSWSKITYKGRKPIRWWYHKLLAEFWYWMYGSSNSKYYKHLHGCLKAGFTLYGQKWQQQLKM